MHLSVKLLHEKTELILYRFQRYFFLLNIIVFVLFSGLLFHTKLFLMGDDADYLVDGYNFIHQNTYPSGRSSLYGMALGGVMLFSGLNIIICKLFSFACAVTGFYLLFKTFKEKVPYWLLFTILFFTAINSAVLYYSSSNLSEAFFMMIQGVYFHAIFLLIKKQETTHEFRRLLPYWCYAGFAGLLVTLSKNVGMLAPLSLAVYYLFKKEYRHALLGLAGFLVFKIPYEILLRLIYGKNTVVGQLGQVMVKDLYYPGKGRENVTGFLARVYKNADIYLGKEFVGILGLKIPHLTFPTWASMISAAIILLICGYAIWLAYKRNRFIFFTGIYLVIMTGISFLALQPDVAQTRIIIIYVPLLFGLLLYGATHLCKHILQGRGLLIVVVVCCICMVVNFKESVVVAKNNLPVLRENISGNKFYGYTPDWLNYLSMGQYIIHTLPDSVGISARKPNSLKVYSGGRNFVWLSPVENVTADDVLLLLARIKVRYLVLASLRLNAEKANGEIITTLHNYVDVIREKYPEKVRTIKEIGDTEPCSLVEILY